MSEDIDQVEVIEEWTPTTYCQWIDGVLACCRKNDFGFPPFITVPQGAVMRSIFRVTRDSVGDGTKDVTYGRTTLRPL